MLAPNRFEVSEWIYDQFTRFGYTEVEYDTFTAYTSISYQFVNEDTFTVQRNVVATLPGSDDPEAVFIVCGHYDSFNSTMDPFRYAPGADDDASGTAAVLEMARVFMENDFVPRRTIKFIAMAAEELMYFGDGGSEHYAAMSDSLDTDIRMVINHDMISHTYQLLTNSTVNVNHHYTADHFADVALDNIDDYTQINGQLDDYYGADLGPFIQHGFTGIYFEESEFSPYYHSSDDVIENYSMEFCTEVIKASCATLIECSTIPTHLADFAISDPDNGSSLLLSWSPNSDYNFNHYKIYVGEESGVYNREETTQETNR
ncbi:MAG: Zn-dependent exopeptidase M28, partial [Calditrichia bacterium]|nr:Zn-dependent exopeptidase M28 [Calditrichia bacterium]